MLLRCPAVREAMAASRSGGATAVGSQAHSRLQRIAWLLVAFTAHFLAALNGVLARYLQASLLALLCALRRLRIEQPVS